MDKSDHLDKHPQDQSLPSPLVDKCTGSDVAPATRRWVLGKIALLTGVPAGRVAVDNDSDTSEQHMVANIEPGERPKVVTEGAQLQDALDTHGAVRIDGTISLDSTVTVPRYTTLYGYGLFSYNDGAIVGDGIQGNIADPLLECRYTSRVMGLALYNQNPQGEALHSSEGINRFHNLDIFARRTGIRCESNAEFGAAVETLVTLCRFTGPDDVYGSVGLRNMNFTDVEVRNNIFRNLATGIMTHTGTMWITQNHLYCGSQHTTAPTNIRLSSEAPYVNITDNYLEGNVATSAISESNYRVRFINNLCRTQVEGGHGLFFKFDETEGSQPLDGCLVKNNDFSARDVQGGTALKTAAVDGMKNGTTIADNIIPSDEWTHVGAIA